VIPAATLASLAGRLITDVELRFSANIINNSAISSIRLRVPNAGANIGELIATNNLSGSNLGSNNCGVIIKDSAGQAFPGAAAPPYGGSFKPADPSFTMAEEFGGRSGSAADDWELAFLGSTLPDDGGTGITCWRLRITYE
jgi:hypothetical protein